MSTHPRCATLAVICAVAISPLLAAPSATATPGCDWNTDRGTQACLGGGPFDAGKNGNGDTYGPTGEAGFLQDNRMSFPRGRDADIIQLGHNICNGLGKGMSERSIKASLVREGLDETTAGAVVISAQMFLC
ncbi:hypothetical protein H8Z59_20295 [Mycolicibacterium fortuitum]|uniref:DUF732 domain-containing protein n=1 Tax=Mycolicibacterium fortuitum TaxID=1766 RepID=UPI001CDCD9AD|nr:DUF732 domain-containing protein [Mycolicibacterium fortuitum]UBV19660.1 hypothetical protein H8Z59_20295 [Mycolicibacterium fortuitum]